MAEALGIISSTIAIWDLACKLRKCYKRIRAAPAVLLEYCARLESLSHAHSVLADMISGQKHATNGIQSKELVALAARELRIIENQANNILGAYNKSLKSSRNRIWYWLRVKRASVNFIAAEEKLQGLVESAEKAKMCLQSAIGLCRLEIINAGQIEMQQAFRKFYDSMKDQADAIERLNRDMELSKIPLHVVGKEGRPVNPLVRNETRAYTSQSKSKLSSRCSNKSRGSPRHGQSRTKARKDKDGKFKAAEDHEFVIQDNQLLIMATDTDEYKSAVNADDIETLRTDLCRIERELESTSQDEWEQGRGNHLYAFQLAEASNSGNVLHDDPSDKTIPIIIDADKRSHAFVGETTKLDECVYDESDSMLFCVAHICITETDQTFKIKEPCDHPCRHIELQIMSKWLERKKLPCMVDFQSITCGVSAGEIAEIEPLSSFTLECYSGCPHRKPCAHTILADGVPVQDGRTRQLIVEDSERLQAWLNSSEEELDTPTESPEESDTPGGGPGSTEDDNEPAMALLEMIHRRDNNVPARIPFETLVGYLKLVERLELDAVHLKQCQIWTNAIISEVRSFDENAIAWAWVFWKLRMGADFTKLTTKMQKEGRHLISEETNQYGVSLPQHVVDAIDRKRISVLSQITDLVQSHINTCVVDYLSARTEDDPDWGTPLEILRSSLTLGYLTLEYEMFLSNDQTEDDGSFDAVSFVGAVDWIRSMMNLGDWEIRTVPPAHRMPFVLSGLAAMVPVLGVGLHEAGICCGLSLNVYEDLNGLIRRLAEEDDWGVDLPDE